MTNLSKLERDHEQAGYAELDRIHEAQDMKQAKIDTEVESRMKSVDYVGDVIEQNAGTVAKLLLDKDLGNAGTVYGINSLVRACIELDVENES